MCTFSSIFSFFYLRQRADSENMKDYASDYCSYLSNIEMAKLQLIDTLATYSRSDSFLEECVKNVEAYQPYNSWIDPFIPINSLSIGSVCANIQTLYSSMDEINPNKATMPAFEYYLVKTNTLL